MKFISLTYVISASVLLIIGLFVANFQYEKSISGKALEIVNMDNDLIKETELGIDLLNLGLKWDINKYSQIKNNMDQDNNDPVEDAFGLEFVSTIRVNPGKESLPKSLAVDSRNRIYTFDTVNKVIIRYIIKDGEYIDERLLNNFAWANNAINAIGGYTNPSGMAYQGESLNAVYILESDGRIVRHSVGVADAYGYQIDPNIGAKVPSLKNPEGITVWETGSDKYFIVSDNTQLSGFGLIANSELSRIDVTDRVIMIHLGPCATADRLSNSPIICRRRDDQDNLGKKTGMRFSNPKGLDFEKDWLYITDSGNHRIVKINKIYLINSFYPFDKDENGDWLPYRLINGVEPIITIGLPVTGADHNGPGQLFIPGGVAVDNLERIFVADTGNNRIQVFDPSGNFIYQLGSEGSGENQFKRPEAIDVMGDLVYVADTYNHRIQIYKIIN